MKEASDSTSRKTGRTGGGRKEKGFTGIRVQRKGKGKKMRGSDSRPDKQIVPR